MNRGKSLRQQQQEWGLDLTGPEPVPMFDDAGYPAQSETVSGPLLQKVALGVADDEAMPIAEHGEPEALSLGAAQPAPITASSRATRGSLVDQLAAPITQDERAVLEDPRASARAQAMRQMVGSISNRMAALAGLPMQPIGESPFVSERDKLRQFILQRGGVAERQAAGEEGRDIRREQLAAAETARLRSEKAAALARGDAMAAREADRKLRERGLELEAARGEREAARGEREERRLRLSEKKAAAPPAVKKAPEGFDVDSVQFGKETLRAKFQPGAPKELRLYAAKQAREAAAKWETVVAAQDKLEEALARFAASPTLANAKLLKGPALSAAAATNAGLGQGAMAEAEKQAQFEALGINMGDLDQFTNAVESAFGSKEAAEAMLGRVRQMRQLARSSVEAQTRGLGYSFDSPSGAAATAAEKPGDMVTVRHKPSGKTKTISKQAAEKYLSSSDFEEVK